MSDNAEPGAGKLEHITLIGSAVIFMFALGTLLALALAVANRFLWVDEDPRVHEVADILPGTNCGACGKAGCHAFAEALVRSEATPAQCTVSAPETIEEIADHLGVDAGEEEKRIAFLACAGGTHVARMRAHYSGVESCRAAAVVGGGPKGCVWGCLGLGDCADVCTFDAISMNRHGLPVVDAGKCTACGDCVDICPKNLFSIHPVSHRLWVACANLQNGEEALAECEVACNACGRCAADAAPGLIEMKNNLPVIDYSKNHLASPKAIQRCPTGAIVWRDEKGNAEKGRETKKIVRDRPLPENV